MEKTNSSTARQAPGSLAQCSSAIPHPSIYPSAHSFTAFNRWVPLRNTTGSNITDGGHGERHHGSCTLAEEYQDHSKSTRATKAFVPYQKKIRLIETGCAPEERVTKKQKVVVGETPPRRRRPQSTLYTFDMIGDEVQTRVLSFLESDELETMMETPWKEIAQRDELWEKQLWTLLRNKFDPAFRVPPGKPSVIPISERTHWNKSTEFRRWYIESLHSEPDAVEDSVRADTVFQAMDFQDNPTNAGKQVPDTIQWLLQDVSLYQFYSHAKLYAQIGEFEARMQRWDDTNRCHGCFQKWHGCLCTFDLSL
jgi:hypothetical protein